MIYHECKSYHPGTCPGCTADASKHGKPVVGSEASCLGFCERNARPGRLTCWHHQNAERAAQKILEKEQMAQMSQAKQPFPYNVSDWLCRSSGRDLFELQGPFSLVFTLERYRILSSEKHDYWRLLVRSGVTSSILTLDAGLTQEQAIAEAGKYIVKMLHGWSSGLSQEATS